MSKATYHYRCRACRHGKTTGCKGRKYKRWGCAGPKKPLLPGVP